MTIDLLSPLQKVEAAGRQVRLLRCVSCGLTPHMRKAGKWLCLKVVNVRRRIVCKKEWSE